MSNRKPEQTVGWREQQKIALRQRLYDVALELFRSQGFDNTTMQQIATEAGVAKGTFFNYFRSKDHIIFEWYQGVTHKALVKVNRGGFAGAADALLAFTNELTAGVAQEKELWRAKTRSAFSVEVVRSGERDLDAELMTFFIEQITSAKQKGEFRSDLDARLFAELVLAVLTGTGHSWVVHGQKFNLRQVTRERVQFIIQAARA